MSITRRDLMSFLPAAIGPGALIAALADAASASAQAAPDSHVLPSAVFQYDSLPVHASKTSESRPIMKGELATGESVEVHETTLQPGGSPHAPHHHEHSEMWLIREGTVEITILGKAQRVGAGGLAFVRSNEEHGITNPGDTKAMYFVVAVGPGADA